MSAEQLAESFNNSEVILADSSLASSDISPPFKSPPQSEDTSATEWSKEGSLSGEKNCQPCSFIHSYEGEISQENSKMESSSVNMAIDQEKDSQFRIVSTSLNCNPTEKEAVTVPSQLQRSSSHQVKSSQASQSQISKQNDSIGSQSNGPTSSMFALMSKQKTIKNWNSSKTLVGGGGQPMRNSLLSNSSHKNESEGGSNGKSMSSSFSSTRKESAGADDSISNSSNGQNIEQSVGSGSGTPQKEQRKIISIKKHIIKSTNTSSNEFQKMEFQDDDIVLHDEQAYLELSRSYDISKSISLAINSKIPIHNSNESQKEEEVITVHKNQILPVLISIKTEEQNYSYLGIEKNQNTINIMNFQDALDTDLKLQGESDWLIQEHQADSECSPGGAFYEMQRYLMKDELEFFSQEYKDEKENVKSLETSKVDEETNNEDTNIEKVLPMKQIIFKSMKESSLKQSDMFKNLISDETSGESILDSQGLNFQQSILLQSNQLINEDKTENNRNEEKQEILNSQIAIDQSIESPQKSNSGSQSNSKVNSPKKLSQKEILMERISSKQKINGDGTPFSPVRFPVDLICVIDTSGSMDGEPLNLVKETLLFLVDLLQKGDRICLIQFSTNAKRLTPLLSIEKNENIEKIKTEINSLIAKGSTNMTLGMQIAFEVMKQRRIKNAISSVFLLSDGLSEGAENRIREVLKSLNFYQNYNENNFTIQTFGFGKDHDPNLMDKISQLMDGNFYYIEDIHRIDECFIDALGGLFSVISKNVQIEVRVPPSMKKYLKIVKTFGEIWQETEEGYSYCININQLLSGVSKDFVLEIELDASIIQLFNQKTNNTEIQENQNGEQSQIIIKEIDDLLSCLLEVKVLVNNLQLSMSNSDLSIAISESLNLSKQLSLDNDKLVNLHYLRVKSAEGLEKCQILAAQKKFDEGKEYVSRLLKELRQQPAYTRNALSNLISDLKEAQDTLQKKISESLGWHRMISCKRMHMEQRSTGTDLTYQNSVQKIMVQRRKTQKDNSTLALNQEGTQKINEPSLQAENEIQKEILSPSNSSFSSKSSNHETSPKQHP